ncbi:MAG: hypothetical protein OXE98_04265, partial [Hyphomicrobiales bacterium]|nr:hypothetical protein [Hyphomicrobiales bacterium]
LTVGAPTTTPTGGTVTFSNPSSASIAEAAGTATITATISPQLPADETVTVTITPSGTAARDTDYTLSTTDGTLTGNMWTLPTQSASATLTVTANDTPGITTDRSLTLAFSGTTSTGGWSITDASHSITINNDDIAKNKVGFAAASKTITVDEDVGTTSLMMQLSNADGTPYTINTPIINFKVRTSGDTNSSDYSISFTNGINDGTWFNNGIVSIFQGGSFTGGLVPVTVTVTDDNTNEGTETFTLTMELDGTADGTGGVFFPKDSWEIDPDNNTVTLTINDDD